MTMVVRLVSPCSSWNKFAEHSTHTCVQCREKWRDLRFEVQGYLGYQNTCARGSVVGNLTPQANLALRKRTKEVGRGLHN